MMATRFRLGVFTLRTAHLGEGNLFALLSMPVPSFLVTGTGPRAAPGKRLRRAAYAQRLHGQGKSGQNDHAWETGRILPCRPDVSVRTGYAAVRPDAPG